MDLMNDIEDHHLLLPAHISERQKMIPKIRTKNIENIPKSNNSLAASNPNQNEIR